MQVTDSKTPLLFRRNSSFRKNYKIVSSGIQFNSYELEPIIHDEQIYTSKKLSWRDLFPQILVSVVGFILYTQPGINMVYSNIILNNYEFRDISELSLLISIPVFCMPIGTIAIGVIMDRIGRKNAILLTCMPLLISWLIVSMASTENINLLYVSRFFAGIGGGMTSVVVIYVSEISHSTYRQMLLSLCSVFFSMGVLFASAVGTLFRWETVNVIFFVFTVIMTGFFFIVLPESPVWLISFNINRPYEAKRSLKRIYPDNDQLFAEEWDRLNYAKLPGLQFENDASPPPPPPTVRRDTATRTWPRLRCRLCCRWSPLPSTVTRPARVLAIIFTLLQFSGAYPVIFYAVPIVKAVMGTGDSGGIDGLSQMDVLVALGVVRLTTSVLACVLSRYIGRRPLLIASSLAMACSAALVAVTCPSAVEPAPSATRLAPLVGVFAFVCSGSTGVLVFPWTLVGELLPPTARAAVGGLLAGYSYALMSAVLHVFPHAFALNVVGGGGLSAATMFAGFAAVSLAMAAYVHARLPETLGKQFREIEEYFAAGPSRTPDVFET